MLIRPEPIIYITPRVLKTDEENVVEEMEEKEREYWKVFILKINKVLFYTLSEIKVWRLNKFL